jgi:colanic acid/amylovoran biosynthesis glycosyltransferase
MEKPNIQISSQSGLDILYIVNQFPSISESFVMNELYELQSRGHNTSVFSFQNSDEKITHSEFDEIEIPIKYGYAPSNGSFIDFLSEEILSFSVFKNALFIDHPKKHAFWLHLGKQISEFVEELGGVDIIHAHFATPNRLAGTYAAAYHNVPCTVTAHAYEIFTPDSVVRLKQVCSRFDHVIVPSEYNKRYLSKEIGIDTEMTIVPATTDVEKFEPSEGCVSGRLLTVARLVEKKGHEYALDAVAELVEQGYDVRYHIVGTGEREEFLRERVRERGIEEYVEFLEHISDERLKTELQDAELFILPCVIASNGDRDVIPVALKEAMATQTACISTTISGIPEMISDEEDGLLVESRNSEALADAIATLFDDPDRRRKLAANGRETVETKFDISKAVDQLEYVFETVQ